MEPNLDQIELALKDVITNAELIEKKRKQRNHPKASPSKTQKNEFSTLDFDVNGKSSVKPLPMATAQAVQQAGGAAALGPGPHGRTLQSFRSPYTKSHQ